MRTSSVGSRLLLGALLVAGCSADDKSAALEPPVVDGKADIAERVNLLGALELGGEVRGELVQDIQFDAYTLDVRAGAEVSLDVTRLGSSRSLDTTLFVFGPRRPGDGYGDVAVAFDDDAGWGRLSRLRGLSLDAGGTYLVVVGTHDGRGRGRYRLTAACDAQDPAACAPVAATLCPRVILDDIARCAIELAGDPDFDPLTHRERLEACADAEPVADAYDAVCAAADAPAFCAESYEHFATELLPTCRAEALAESCTFGATYRDVFTERGLYVTHRRVLTAASALTVLERAQVVAAVRTSAHDDVTTTQAAFAAVDGGEINQLELWDATARAAYTSYEFGAGDNSYGALFAQGTSTRVARINDGDLAECTAHPGPELTVCRADADCAFAGGRCEGVAGVSGLGRCVRVAADVHPSLDAACAPDDGCPVGSGLLCAGAYGGPSGMCIPAWRWQRFATAPGLTIPNGNAAGVGSDLVVFGLATVHLDLRVRVDIDHPDVSQLRIWLTNPAGTESQIYAGAASGTELRLDLEPSGFPGDEYINGAWTLRVADVVTGGGPSATGALLRWDVEMSSRWD